MLCNSRSVILLHLNKKFCITISSVFANQKMEWKKSEIEDKAISKFVWKYNQKFQHVYNFDIIEFKQNVIHNVLTNKKYSI